MSKHAMAYEGRSKKGKVKTARKASVVVRKLNAWKRQAWNALGAVGCAVVVWWLIQMAMGGG